MQWIGEAWRRLTFFFWRGQFHRELGSADFVPFEVCGFFLGMCRKTAEFPKTGNSALPPQLL